MSISAGKAVLVTVKATRGSAPRAAGAWMAVGPDSVSGTIGGGQLEYMAIDAARSGRRGGMNVPLGPEIGQCCGGSVTLLLEETDIDAVSHQAEADRRDWPHVLIFGAGHTGRALAEQMAHLPARSTLIDSRDAELSRATIPPGNRRLSAIPEAEVRTAPPGTAYVVLTHDHALDFLIAGEALRRGDAAYVGMIGSATKRARFERWHREQGGDPSRLICPIGASAPADKRPEIIAAFTATEILSAFARVRETAS